MTLKTAMLWLFRIILLLIFMAGIVVVNRYGPIIVDVLMRPLITLGAIVSAFVLFNRLIAEQKRLFAMVVAAVNAASQTTSAELQQLRSEVQRQSEPQGAKALGFQPPESKG